MSELLPVLTPIALLDSATDIPIYLVFLLALLGGASPLLRSAAFLTGILVTYLAFGLLVLFGLQRLFAAIGAYAFAVWQSPNTAELIIQIVFGIALIVLGVRIARTHKRRAEVETPGSLTFNRAFLAGAGITFVGLPSAVPYLSAINLILRSDQTPGQDVITLVVYNFVFIAPLAAIVALGLVLGERGQAPLLRIRGSFDRWGFRLVVTLMLALGVLLVLDGFGWFLGRPLIPVPSAGV